MAGRVLPGDPERERGVTLASKYREPDSHLILARKNRGLESHLTSASYFCKLFWQAILAPQFGRFSPQVNLAGDYSAGFKDETKQKKKK
jgi:hypothetical protein